jgi:hypothetical protein
MPFECGFVYPPWALADDLDLLDRMQGEIGLDHLTLPVVTGSHARLQLSGDDAPRWVAVEAGWHFSTGHAGCERSDIPPHVTRSVGRRGALEPVATYARRFGLALHVRLDVRAALAGREAAAAALHRNAWGQTPPHAGGCVMQPAVRQLLRQTLRDLAQFAPDGVQLVDWAPDVSSGGDTALTRVDPGLRELLDLCFCDACRDVARRGGIDDESAARSVQASYQRRLRAAEGGGRAGPSAAAHSTAEPPLLRESDPVCSAYVAARRADTLAWLDSLAREHAERWRMLVWSSAEAEGRIASEGWAPLAWLGCSGGQQLPSIGATGDDGDGAGVRLFAWRPHFERGSQLVRTVHDLAARGRLACVEFEDLDQCPPQSRQWIRQAVRYARREQCAG